MITIEEKLRYFINNERALAYSGYDLAAITELLGSCSNPHRRLVMVHIAGTNGKGSIAHMLANIFQSAGLRTGLYTSPHLVQVNERIMVNNTAISDASLSFYIDAIINIYSSNSAKPLPTYFDVLTVIALRYFQEQKTDISVIETGLGGRLDSTNVITPACSVISDISIDHAHVLGNTLAKIAAEKAGIIKPHVPVITTNSNPEILEVINKHAAALHSPLFIKDRDFAITDPVKHGTAWRYAYQSRLDAIAIHDIVLNLIPDFQVQNSSAAICAALLLSKTFPQIDAQAIKQGLRDVAVPGRMQQLRDRPPVFFDPAHNPAAIEKMVALFSKEYSNKKIIYIISIMQDKDHAAIIALLQHTGSRVLYVELPDSRCYKPSLSNEHPGLEICSNERALLEQLRREDPHTTLYFFTGTFRLYALALSAAMSIPAA